MENDPTSHFAGSSPPLSLLLRSYSTPEAAIAGARCWRTCLRSSAPLTSNPASKRQYRSAAARLEARRTDSELASAKFLEIHGAFSKELVICHRELQEPDTETSDRPKIHVHLQLSARLNFGQLCNRCRLQVSCFGRGLAHSDWTALPSTLDFQWSTML